MDVTQVLKGVENSNSSVLLASAETKTYLMWHVHANTTQVRKSVPINQLDPKLQAPLQNESELVIAFCKKHEVFGYYLAASSALVPISMLAQVQQILANKGTNNNITLV